MGGGGGGERKVNGIDREGRNKDKEEIPDSGESICSYILTYSVLKKERLPALGSQQSGP